MAKRKGWKHPLGDLSLWTVAWPGGGYRWVITDDGDEKMFAVSDTSYPAPEAAMREFDEVATAIVKESDNRRLLSNSDRLQLLVGGGSSCSWPASGWEFCCLSEIGRS